MKQLLTLLLIVLSATCCFSQQLSPPCAAQVEYDKAMRSDPLFRERDRGTNLRIKDYIDRYLQKGLSKPGGDINQVEVVFGTPTYLIPVVVHVLHTGQSVGSGTNISYNQIRSQIDAMNAAFARVYGTAGYNNGQSHPAYAVNTNIQFCLARIVAGPAGWTDPAEPGVMRYSVSNALSNPGLNQPDAQNIFNFTHPNPAFFPVDRYLNIWIVTSIGGGNSVLGYATFPTANMFAPLDGMVMRADCFGDNSVNGNSFPLNANATQGKIAAHEAGHYLNLLHIFNNGCAGMNAAGSSTDPCDLNGDNICDIAPCTTQGFTCTSPIPNTCTETYATGTTANDMVEDYMSYAQDLCMTTFTADQRNRMQATLNILRPNLWTQDNLVSTGVAGPNSDCLPGILLATINRPVNICSGQPVQYTTNTQAGNTAATWSWQFPGGTPATSTLQTPPPVTYAAPGTYTVTLTVTDGLGDTLVNVDTIFVSTCQVDPCRISQAHWYFGSFAAIDFNSGTPTPLNTASANNTINIFEPAITESDPQTGALRFYASCRNVWNSSHAPFAGGPLPAFIASSNSSSQMLSVPFPGHNNQFYLFYPPSSEDIWGGSVASGQLRFALVDAGGAGTILSTGTCTPHSTNPTGNLCEGITAVPHCNGRDYWIIVRGFNTDRRFYVYLLSPHGLTNGTLSSTQPDVYPATGSFGFTSPSLAQQLKASPDGTHLAMSGNAGLALYNFSNVTGAVTGEVVATMPMGLHTSGCSFSPNSQYVYTVRWGQPQIDKVSVASGTVISSFSGTHNYQRMQLGPDNRIYMVNNGPINYYDARIMDAIVNPDNAGTNTIASAAVDFGPMNANINTQASIPNCIDVCDIPETTPECFAIPLNCSTYRFNISNCWGMYQAVWNFGDGSPNVSGNPVTHTFTSPGTYTVTVRLVVPLTGEVFFVCTQTVTVIDLNVEITGPGIVCRNQAPPPIYSMPSIPGAVYNWTVVNGSITGPANGSSINVSWPNLGTGAVIVTMSFNGCQVRDTLPVTIINCDPPACDCGSWRYTRWSFYKYGNGVYQPVSANFKCGDTLKPGMIADSVYQFYFGYSCNGDCEADYTVSSNLPDWAYTASVHNGGLQVTYKGSYRFCGLNYFKVTPICGNQTCPPCIVYFSQTCSPCGEIIKDTVYCDPHDGPVYDFCVQNNSTFPAYLIKVKIPSTITPFNITAPAGATYTGNTGGYYYFQYPAGLLPQQSLCGFHFSIAQPYTPGQQVCLGLALHKEDKPPYISCCEDTFYKRCFIIPDCRAGCAEIFRDEIICTDKGPFYTFCVQNNSNFTTYLIKIKIPAPANPVNIVAPAGATYTGSMGDYYLFYYPAGLAPGHALCGFGFYLAPPYYAGQEICLGVALHKEDKPPFISCCEDVNYKHCFVVPDCPNKCMTIIRPSITCKETHHGYEFSFNFMVHNNGWLAELDSLELQYINPSTMAVSDWCNYRLTPAVTPGGSSAYLSCKLPFSPVPGSTLCFRVIGYDLHWLGGVWCIKDSCVSDVICVKAPDCRKEQGHGGDIEAPSVTRKWSQPGHTGFSVYPNPVNNVVTVTAPDGAAAIQSIVIRSVTGQAVAQYRVNSQPRYTTNLAGLKAGLYIITVNNRFQYKLLKE